MKNKKAFTLVELLAVIVILAVVALIAVPIVLNVIDDSDKKAFENTSYGINKAALLYYAKMDSEDDFNGKEFDFSKDVSELEFEGKKPAGGILYIDDEGKVSFALYDAKKSYCALKKMNSEEIKIIDYDELDCDYTVATDESCFTFDSKTGTITGYSDSCPKDVVIPNKINDVAVLKIGASAFYYKEIKRVILPKGLTTIGISAFAENFIRDLYIPQGVKTIDIGAFSGNYISSIEIPNSVTTMNSYAFHGNQLSNVIIHVKISNFSTRIQNSIRTNNKNNQFIHSFDGSFAPGYTVDDIVWDVIE